MARRKRRRSKSDVNAGSIAAIIILAALIAALVGGYGYLRLQASQTVKLDPETFCPADGPVSVTAVLLDLTDPVAKPTLTDIQNRFEALMAEIPEGGQLTVFALTEQTSEIQEKVSVCNPGNGQNVDPLIANPRLAKQRWEEAYHRPLEAFVEGLSNQASASRSPIMAGIQQIALNLFQSPRYANMSKRLIVVSDMLEHTDAYSHYRDGASMTRYRASDAYDLFRVPLNGLDVQLLLIQRLNAPVEQLDLAEFWAAWFQANQARNVNIVRLAGAT
jgi:hypothetical protein